MSQLRQKMIRAMDLKNLSNPTKKAYLSAVTGLARYYQASPGKITEDQIDDYLLYLKNEKDYAPSSCHSVLTGLRFFYQNILRDPVKKPEYVLEYLARYTRRVAIANSRITKLENGMVTFKVKNRKKDRTEQLTVTAVEFIRRFLLHSLPKRFVRIRHYGFLANRNRTANLNNIRRQMALSVSANQVSESVEDMMLNLTGKDITACPCCHKGKMQLVWEIPKYLARPPNPLAFRAA